MVVASLPCRLSQFESNWATRRLLPDRGPVGCIAPGSDGIAFERDDVAAAELAIDNSRRGAAHLDAKP